MHFNQPTEVWNEFGTFLVSDKHEINPAKETGNNSVQRARSRQQHKLICLSDLRTHLRVHTQVRARHLPCFIYLVLCMYYTTASRATTRRRCYTYDAVWNLLWTEEMGPSVRCGSLAWMDVWEERRLTVQFRSYTLQIDQEREREKRVPLLHAL